jgi:prepilin-type N-terminal cleavage/methylation domain-containing protein
VYREREFWQVLTSRSVPHRDDDSEAGFTLLEIMIVALIMGIVLSIAGAALFSLGTTANRNESMVAQEQAASNALAQFARDVRSANSVAFPSGATTSDSTNEVELVDNTTSGGATTVEWIYDHTAATLTRNVLVNGTFSASGPQVSRVANPAGSPMFTYYDGKSGTDISSTSVSNIATCSTAITIDVWVGPSTSGVNSVEENEQVAMTNQVNDLTAPGNGQC